jgi:hypothetical protein
LKCSPRQSSCLQINGILRYLSSFLMCRLPYYSVPDLRTLYEDIRLFFSINITKIIKSIRILNIYIIFVYFLYFRNVYGKTVREI